MLAIALELARDNRSYEEIASKFFEHFVYISRAMNNIAGEGIELWNKEDGFFYDVLHLPTGEARPLKVRSMVGLIPLFAVETLEPELLEKVPEFKRRLEWFLSYRPDLASLVSHWNEPGRGHRRLLSLLRGHRMKKILRRLLDETEFLERVFHKLMLNFTWWVNRKDAEGRNIFQGGFLGLDNIGIFDRSKPLPTGGYINQSDGTAWMAMYTLNLLRIANELAFEEHVY
jgi:hypothetical protein